MSDAIVKDPTLWDFKPVHGRDYSFNEIFYIYDAQFQTLYDYILTLGDKVNIEVIHEKSGKTFHLDNSFQSGNVIVYKNDDILWEGEDYSTEEPNTIVFNNKILYDDTVRIIIIHSNILQTSINTYITRLEQDISKTNETYEKAQQLNNLIAELEERLNQKIADYKSEQFLVEDIANRIGKKAAVVNKEYNELTALSSELKKDAQDLVNTARAETTQMIKSVEDTALVCNNSIKNEANQAINTVRAENSQAIEAVRAETIQAVNTVRSENAEAVNTVRREANQAVSTVRSESASAISAIDETSERVRSEYSELVSDAERRTQDAVDLISDEVFQATHTIRTEATDAIKTVTDSSEEAVRLARAESSQAITNIRNTVRDALNTVNSETSTAVESVQNESSQAVNTIREESNRAVGVFEDKYEELDYLADKLEIYYDRILAVQRAIEEMSAVDPEGSTDSEVILARNGAVTLGDRLNGMLYKFNSTEDMRKCLFLRDGDSCAVLNSKNDIRFYRVTSDTSSFTPDTESYHLLVDIEPNLWAYLTNTITSGEQIPIQFVYCDINPKVAPKGSTILTFTINWKTNKVPKDIRVNGVSYSNKLNGVHGQFDASIDIASNSAVYVVVEDTDGNLDEVKLGIVFENFIFYGVSSNPDDVNQEFLLSELEPLLITGGRLEYGVNSSGDNYIWLAYPTSVKDNVLLYCDGFYGGFDYIKDVSFENMVGYSESYSVYRTTYSNLGKVTITAKGFMDSDSEVIEVRVTSVYGSGNLSDLSDSNVTSVVGENSDNPIILNTVEPGHYLVSGYLKVLDSDDLLYALTPVEVLVSDDIVSASSLENRYYFISRNTLSESESDSNNSVEYTIDDSSAVHDSYSHSSGKVFQNKVKSVSKLPSIGNLRVAPLVDHDPSGVETDIVPSVYTLKQDTSSDGNSANVVITVQDLKKHYNSSGVDGYWVGFAVPVQDDVDTFYELRLGNDTYTSDDIPSWLSRTCEIAGKRYNTIYLRDDDWSSSVSCSFNVSYSKDGNSVLYMYNITFNVKVEGADEPDIPPVEPEVNVNIRRIKYILVLDGVSYLNEIILRDGEVYSRVTKEFNND